MQNNTTSEQTLDNNEDGEVVGCGSDYSEGHELDDDNKNVDIYWVDAQIIETLRPKL